MRRVILDTNFLMIPGALGVDIFTELERVAPEYDLYVIDKTLDELKKLGEKMALEMVEQFNIKLINTSKEDLVDDLIVEHATKDDLVATQDKELKDRLREKGIDLVVLRKKKYLNVIKT